MRGSRAALVGLVVLVLVVSAEAPAAQRLGDGEVVPVAITNFPETVRVEGKVSVQGPIDSTSLSSIADVIVAPTKREDTTHFVEAGTIETRGFAAAVVSLLGEVKGSLVRPGDVGAVLLPDDEFVVRAFNEKGQFLLAQEITVTPPAPGMPYFAAKPVRFTVAYPRYRVFLYNACDKAVSVTVHAYLTN